ncbi:hypothetical protein [Microbacterium testaceum]|uniref:Phage tail protein n=1 Tax=Microbacterium testaceum TaxID=2033 RepID=A0A2T7WQD1_MICTE|nr:hypothetical protein [Microbacterium testaceum]PVE76101.1 hypothetical protein DC432_06610 [Microbacterium testaceum]
MAVVVNKTFLNKATITIGADEYTNAFRDPALTPTTPEVSVIDASGTAVPLNGKSTWVFTGVLYQDWTSTGLAKSWFTNEGNEATIKLILPGTQGVFTFKVLLKAPTIGGATNAAAESAVSLNVSGTPVWSAS